MNFIERYKTKGAVRERLKDPESALFSDDMVIHPDGSVCGFVNARSIMGGYTGKTPFRIYNNYVYGNIGDSEDESLNITKKCQDSFLSLSIIKERQRSNAELLKEIKRPKSFVMEESGKVRFVEDIIRSKFKIQSFNFGPRVIINPDGSLCARVESISLIGSISYPYLIFIPTDHLRVEMDKPMGVQRQNLGYFRCKQSIISPKGLDLLQDLAHGKIEGSDPPRISPIHDGSL